MTRRKNGDGEGWTPMATREFTVKTAVTGLISLLIVCAFPPYSDLQGNLVQHLILPRYEEMTSNVPWKEAGVTSRLPSALFPAGESGAPIHPKTRMRHGRMHTLVRHLPDLPASTSGSSGPFQNQKGAWLQSRDG